MAIGRSAQTGRPIDWAPRTVGRGTRPDARRRPRLRRQPLSMSGSPCRAFATTPTPALNPSAISATRCYFHRRAVALTKRAATSHMASGDGMSESPCPDTSLKRRRVIQGSVAAGGSLLASLYVKPTLTRLGTPTALAVSGAPLPPSIINEPGPLRLDPIATTAPATPTPSGTPTASPTDVPGGGTAPFGTATSSVPVRETPRATSTQTPLPSVTPTSTATPTGATSPTATSTATSTETGAPGSNPLTGSRSSTSSEDDGTENRDDGASETSGRSARGQRGAQLTSRSALTPGEEVDAVANPPGGTRDSPVSAWQQWMRSGPAPSAARVVTGATTRTLPSLLPMAGDAGTPWLAGVIGGLTLIAAGVQLQLRGRRKAAELARREPSDAQDGELADS
jgi:hypothetical protein